MMEKMPWSVKRRLSSQHAPNPFSHTVIITPTPCKSFKPQVERFYEGTTTDLAQQLGFLKAQLRGDGNKSSQLALEDLSAWV